MSRGYRFLEHMTDALIEAYGATTEEAFEQAALGLVETMIDLRTITPDRELTVDAEGHDLESLLFDWLDKVMLILVADGIAMSEFFVKIEKENTCYALTGIAKGEKLDLTRHKYKVEIKAVTYHEMSVKQESDQTTVKFLLDL